ncbi:hypothetical protein AB4486_27225, partial [Vibrio sp. 10N.222.55.C6]|uniref:hypothetical protein n=1 Tax=Vibrio sp. 10N.222.55.C6 TaxID=3229649 RepID=UPI00355469CC
TRTPRKNTTFHKVATAKLAQNESSLFTQLRTISSKSHAQMMSKRLKWMNINATYTATDNQHLFILDDRTSFIFVVNMFERAVSCLKIMRISVIAIARFGLFRSLDPAVFL